MKHLFLAFVLSITLCGQSIAQPLKLVTQKIHLKRGLTFDLQIPEAYHISVAAEGLKRPRFFSKSPDGRLFITDMYNRDDNKKGRILILDRWNEKRKGFDSVITFMENLHNPNQIAFYTTMRQTYLYIAETDKLTMRPYSPGDNHASAQIRTIATFPAYGLDYKYGGWHLTRSITIHNNKLYVSVGSSCNACVEKEEIRATVVEMNMDGTNQTFYARGLRNAVGIKWVGNTLWATGMGRDLIGPDKPEDLFLSIKKGGYYGWPYYFQYKRQVLADTQFKDSAKSRYTVKPAVAEYGFLAHSAPLGFEYFSGFKDALLNNTFLVALHGSTSVWRQRGNAVVQMTPNGYRDFVTGFLQGKTEDKRFGRPCDVIQWSANSFFISDDKNGVIYYVWRD